MGLLPREHGAYGQVAFPLATALAVSGVTPPAALIGFAVVAGFLAHEPLVVRLGRRGQRARREHAAVAAVWLYALGGSATGATAIAFAWLPASERWTLLVPAVPAIAVVLAILAGREKTWPAEVAVSLAFSGVAFPIAVAAGAIVPIAATVAIAFAVNFVLATLAVRVVILKVRAGGDPAAMASTRRAVFILACGVLVGIAGGCLGRLLPWTALAASIPGIVVSVRLAASPPSSKLRAVGWALIATSIATSAILIGGLRLSSAT